jgi:hypothetical protein
MTLVEILLVALLVVGFAYVVRAASPADMRQPARILVLVVLLLIVVWLMRGRLG